MSALKIAAEFDPSADAILHQGDCLDLLASLPDGFAVKGKLLVGVQFGKYFAMFYDMAKFQYFFNENKADVGVEIVPCHTLHKHMSRGVSFGEQLVYDIERLKRHFPAVPVKVS